MLILHVLQSNTFSGAENVVCQIINIFRNSPNIEMVYCSPDGQIRHSLEERGIKFVPLLNLTKKELAKVVESLKPDIIHAHDRTASFVASKVCKKIPLVVHMHVNNNKGLSFAAKNFIWILRSRKYKHIFWVSASSFNGFQFHKFLSKKSSILYNIINVDETRAKASLGSECQKYDACYVGRLTEQKDPKRLMNVVNMLISNIPTFKVAIVGSGDYEEYIKDFIETKRINNNVFFYGYLQNPLRIIQNSKMLILTSKFEGTPMVALEALSLGTPVLSTRVDGLIDVIQEGKTGFLCCSDDDYYKNCLTILDDKTSYFYNNCRQSSDAICDVERYKKRIEEVYFKYAKLE